MYIYIIDTHEKMELFIIAIMITCENHSFMIKRINIHIVILNK